MVGLAEGSKAPRISKEVPGLDRYNRDLSPMQMLYPRQRAFVEDESRFKLGVFSRQTGKSLTTSGEAVRDCIRKPGTTWVCLSSGERQALEWLGKAKLWLKAYQYVFEKEIEDRGGYTEALLRSAEIKFSNGSRIIAIPANPATARGLSGNIVLDEFAYHDDPDGIWTAAFPFLANNEAGVFMEKWQAIVDNKPFINDRVQKIRVVSTFNGKDNKFHSLYEKRDANGFSVHEMTIHDAIADGMQLNLEQLKAGMEDPDRWEEEFECKPLNSTRVFLPYPLISSCESQFASVEMHREYWHSATAHRCVMGVDFARNGDLSVAWTGECRGPLLHTVDVMEMKKMSTPDQVDILRSRINKCDRISIDYNGPGIGFGDYLVREHGEWNPDRGLYGKVELFTFTNKSKNDLFHKMKFAFESGKVAIPESTAIREDLHSVQRVVTKSGNITYEAPRTNNGHADRCVALSLALRAKGDANAVAIPIIGNYSGGGFQNDARSVTLY